MKNRRPTGREYAMKQFRIQRIKFVVACVLMLASLPLFINAVSQFDLTTQVKGILPSANGGTASAFFAVSGPTQVRTFTFPDANGTVMMTTTGVSATQLPNPGAATLGGVQSKDCSSTAIGKINTDGTVTCLASIPGPNFLDQATPTGTVDGTNAAFTTSQTCVAASLMLFKNGQLMTNGASADYTLSGTTITYTAGAKPKSGDVHTYSCRY
jgi:hypothetical protein